MQQKPDSTYRLKPEYRLDKILKSENHAFAVFLVLREIGSVPEFCEIISELAQ